MKKMTDLFYIILIIIAVSFFVFLWLAGEANAECGINQPVDAEPKDPFAVTVCADVVGMVCTPDSPFAECQDAAIVARLDDDDVVIVKDEK